MEEMPPQEPWVEIAAWCRAGDSARVLATVDAMPAGELARVLSRLDQEDRRTLLGMLGPERSAVILESVSSVQAVDLLGGLTVREAAEIVGELDSADRADVLADIPHADAEAILRRLEPEAAADARELLAYDPRTAGGLMKKELLTFRRDESVAEVFEDLRRNAEEYSDYAIQYGYVVHPDGRLAGVLRLRDLLFAPKGAAVPDVMIDAPLALPVDAPLEELVAFFGEHTFVGAPVVDAAGRLLGVVERSAVDAAEGDEADETLLKFSGIVGGEEIRTMPVRIRSMRRLSWLSANILLNVISASVIALHEETLRSVIALAVFLPIISDMSGCSGNQAVTVSIRELTLGLVRPEEVRRVLLKELSVGLINGLVLGLFLGALAFAWKGNIWLGIVVGGSLMINTVVSVCLGGSLPLVLKRLGRDPALAAAPILTTVTDLCGFLTALGFAAALVAKLQ